MNENEKKLLQLEQTVSRLDKENKLMAEKLKDLYQTVDIICKDHYTFNTLEEIPDYAKETIEKMFNNGYLNSDDDEGMLNLSRDLIKMFVCNDKTGIYDNEKI